MELRTTLNERMTEKFMVVKEHTCMKANNNVLAFLISEAYDKIQDTKYRKLFVTNETYERLEKEAEAQGMTVDLYVTELTERALKEAKEGVKHAKT